MDIRLIPIKQDWPGLEQFISSWLISDRFNIAVDVGPNRTAERLLGAMAAMGIERLDYVLLTHIHIDHAGGLAKVLEHYPMAKAICHAKGVRFLVEPAKLWEGSLKVLGKLAEAYGAPQPVEADRLIPHTENPLPPLEVVETPGHAPHHLSFSYEQNLFAGEAGGNYFVIDAKEYLRPATPPRFFLDVCLSSVDRMLALEDQPIHYAHFGRAENSHRLLKMFRDQLMRWNDLIYEQICLGKRDLVQRCLDTLIERDPDLAAFKSLGKDDQERERYFMTNSVRGFVEYFQERDEKRETS